MCDAFVTHFADISKWTCNIEIFFRVLCHEYARL